MAAAKGKQTDDDLPKNTKGKIFKIVLLLVLLIILGSGAYVGGAYFFNWPPFEKRGPNPEQLAVQRAAVAEASREAKRDVYLSCGDPFTLNLVSYNKTHTVQINIFLAVPSSDEELLKKHLSLVNSIIDGILSKQSFEELRMPSGKQRLKLVLLDAIRKKLSEVTHNPIVTQVLFTGFVMQ